MEEGRVVPYRLARPLYPGDSNSGACLCYIAMKRGSAGGGFLALIPNGFLQPSELQDARTGPVDGPIGPHTVLTVPSVLVLEDGAEEEAGDIDILLVDFSSSVAHALTEMEELEPDAQQQVLGFLDDLDVFPVLEKALGFAREWVEVQTAQRAAFYSAEEFQEPVPETPGPGINGQEEEDEELLPEAAPKKKVVPKAKKVSDGCSPSNHRSADAVAAGSTRVEEACDGGGRQRSPTSKSAPSICTNPEVCRYDWFPSEGQADGLPDPSSAEAVAEGVGFSAGASRGDATFRPLGQCSSGTEQSLDNLGDAFAAGRRSTVRNAGRRIQLFVKRREGSAFNDSCQPDQGIFVLLSCKMLPGGCSQQPSSLSQFRKQQRQTFRSFPT